MIVITQNIKKKEALKKSPFFISYLITDPVEYGNTEDAIINSLDKSFRKNDINMICFRDKITKDIKNLAQAVLQISKLHNIAKVLINSNIELALELGFDGVHLTSKQFDKIRYAKEKSLYVIVSCHTQQEIEQAKNFGADSVTYSPIFYKEKKGVPKGCENLEQMIFLYQDDFFKIIALGGIITDEHIQEVKKTNAYGFASIRYFLN